MWTPTGWRPGPSKAGVVVGGRRPLESSSGPHGPREVRPVCQPRVTSLGDVVHQSRRSVIRSGRPTGTTGGPRVVDVWGHCGSTSLSVLASGPRYPQPVRDTTDTTDTTSSDTPTRTLGDSSVSPCPPRPTRRRAEDVSDGVGVTPSQSRARGGWDLLGSVESPSRLRASRGHRTDLQWVWTVSEARSQSTDTCTVRQVRVVSEREMSVPILVGQKDLPIPPPTPASLPLLDKGLGVGAAGDIDVTGVMMSESRPLVPDLTPHKTRVPGHTRKTTRDPTPRL